MKIRESTYSKSGKHTSVYVYVLYTSSNFCYRHTQNYSPKYLDICNNLKKGLAGGQKVLYRKESEQSINADLQ